MDWERLSKWLYPGMRVKRWVALGVASALLVGFSLILLIGRSTIDLLYELLSANLIVYYFIAAVALVGGIVGVIWSVNRLALSVTDPMDRLSVRLPR